MTCRQNRSIETNSPVDAAEREHDTAVATVTSSGAVRRCVFPPACCHMVRGETSNQFTFAIDLIDLKADHNQTAKSTGENTHIRFSNS